MAHPIFPPDSRARSIACSRGTPRASSNSRAIVSTGTVRKSICWHRERMVSGIASLLLVSSISSTDSGGSSRSLSRALDASEDREDASWNMNTRLFPS